MLYYWVDAFDDDRELWSGEFGSHFLVCCMMKRTAVQFSCDGLALIFLRDKLYLHVTGHSSVVHFNFFINSSTYS